MSQPFRRALVTGASRGIGAAIARRLAGEGVDLVLVARTGPDLTWLADELERAHRITAEVMIADLLDPFGLERVTDRVDASPKIDLVVNNAGFGTTGPFVASDADIEQDEIRLNVQALVALSHAAASTFRERGTGGILNVSSLASVAPLAGAATYGATKAFVTSFTQALHEELRPAGVHVSALCPGFTRTDAHDPAGIPDGGLGAAMWSCPDDVAVAGIAGVRANRAAVVPGAANRAVAGAARLLPAGLVRRGAGLLSGPRPG